MKALTTVQYSFFDHYRFIDQDIIDIHYRSAEKAILDLHYKITKRSTTKTSLIYTIKLRQRPATRTVSSYESNDNFMPLNATNIRETASKTSETRNAGTFTVKTKLTRRQ